MPLRWAPPGDRWPTGGTYGGKTSPWWYDAGHFHELLLASRAQPVRALVASLDGCTGGRRARSSGGRLSASLQRGHARRCRRPARGRAREEARRVKPERLGSVGSEDGRTLRHRARRGGVRASLPSRPNPVCRRGLGRAPSGATHRTESPCREPDAGHAESRRALPRSKNKAARCVRLRAVASFRPAPKGSYDVTLNITTPYMPITSDGKAPDLAPFLRRDRRGLEQGGAQGAPQRAEEHDER